MPSARLIVATVFVFALAVLASLSPYFLVSFRSLDALHRSLTEALDEVGDAGEARVLVDEAFSLLSLTLVLLFFILVACLLFFMLEVVLIWIWR